MRRRRGEGCDFTNPVTVASVIEIRKRRASGAPGVRFAATLVGRDQAGTWLLVEPAAPHVHDDGWVEYLSPNPVLLVFPEAGRWVASTSHTGAKVDLCSSITFGFDWIEFVDVELDVVWRWGEPARIDDLEEFQALAMEEAEAGRYLEEAERVRAAVDAGVAPFGPSFRERLVERVEQRDARLLATWAGAVGPHWVDAVSTMVGPEWVDRQRRGTGWLLCGGRHEVTAVVWLDGQGGARLLAAAQTPEGAAMGAFLLEAAPNVGGFEVRPLPPRSDGDATSRR